MNEKFRTTLTVDDYIEEKDRENKMLAWKKIGFGVNAHEQEDQFYVYGNMNANTLMNALVRLKANIKEAIQTKDFSQILHPADLVEVMFKFDSKYETDFSQQFQEDCTLLSDYYQNQSEVPIMSFENENSAEINETSNQSVSVENAVNQEIGEQVNTNTSETETPENQSGETIEDKKEETIETKNETQTEENKEPERNIKIEVVNSGDLKVEDIIEIGPKGVSNKQMIPAMKKAVEEKSREKLSLLKTTYPDIYESSIKYIGNKRQQELKTLEEEIAKAQ